MRCHWHQAGRCDALARLYGVHGSPHFAFPYDDPDAALVFALCVYSVSVKARTNIVESADKMERERVNAFFRQFYQLVTMYVLGTPRTVQPGGVAPRGAVIQNLAIPDIQTLAICVRLSWQMGCLCTPAHLPTQASVE